jgi:hypothetical protein
MGERYNSRLVLIMKTLYYSVFLLSGAFSCAIILLILGTANINELGKKTVDDGILLLGQTTLGPVSQLSLIKIEDKLGYGGDFFIVEFQVEGDIGKTKVDKEAIRFYGFNVIGERQ